MSDGTIQIAPESTGPKIDTSEIVVGANTVDRQRIVLADDTAALGLCRVLNAQPAASDYGLVVRVAGQTVIQGLQPAATTGNITTATTNIPSATGLDVQQYNIATVRISGTYAGVNVIFEQSDNGGTTWYATQGARCESGVIESTSGALTNITRAWDIPIGGANRIRVRATAWTSGTAAIAIGIQSFAYDPCPGVVSQGPSANGTALAGNPVLTAGSDGTNARSLSVTSTGVLNVSATPALPTTTFINSTNSVNATTIKASAGTLYGVSASNIGAATAYLKIYNIAITPVVASSVPILVIPIPAGTAMNYNFGSQGQRHGTGIGLVVSGAAVDTDTTAVAASQVKVAITFI